MSKPANFPTRPGIYLLAGWGAVFIELMGDGKVFQLDKSTFNRDGELDDEGWGTSPMEFYGPLRRPSRQLEGL